MADHARPHLSIGEVLSLLQPEFPDITISKIRFLESQGLLDPERTPSGYRKFYDDDLARLRWILTQQRDHFLPLKVIKERLADAGPGALPADDPGATGASTTSASTTGEAPAESNGESGGTAPTPTSASASPSAPGATTPGDRAALAEALARRAAQRGEQAPTAAPATSVVDPDLSDTSFTAAELAAAADITERDVERLASFGLIQGRTIGREVIFDGDSLHICRLAAGFLQRGLEPRHLRMFKVAAEREAGIYEQLIAPITRQRNPEARERAERRLNELADLGHQLRAAMLRRAVRDVSAR